MTKKEMLEFIKDLKDDDIVEIVDTTSTDTDNPNNVVKPDTTVSISAQELSKILDSNYQKLVDAMKAPEKENKNLEVNLVDFEI